MKRILMIATGGTIASRRSGEGLKPLITSEELLDYVPDVRRFCQADAIQALNIDSTIFQHQFSLHRHNPGRPYHLLPGRQSAAR